MARPPSSPRGCRFCGAGLGRVFADLGMTPLCQKHVEPEALHDMEPFYPLRALVCDRCFLVQVEDAAAPDELFSDYAYFSSYSESWVRHARDYVEKIVPALGLGTEDFVVEIASNDGYLLRHFVERGIPARGIEPAENVAMVAEHAGIPTTIAFFGEATAVDFAARYGHPRLVIGNNVLAHVPDINDFVTGLRKLLAPDGVITMEFPHLVRLIEGNQFDTIYHEHFSYLSFTVVERIFAHHGLTVFDVDELATHGGSLRIHARHAKASTPQLTPRVADLRERERAFGIERPETYDAFAERVRRTKRRLLEFLIRARDAGARIAGYGAPGKGNTLLNYCGIGTDFLDFTVDRSPHKQGRYTPGTRIPILAPEAIREARPDYLLILPWNLADEIREQTGWISEWGGQWVVPIPEVQVIAAPGPAGGETRTVA